MAPRPGRIGPMPFHSRATLAEWVAEFRELGYGLEGSLRVIEQDGEDGSDTGLVYLELAHAPTTVYVQPVVGDGTRWVVTFEGRDEPAEVTAAGVARLSTELAALSALCAFLQAKSASEPGAD